MQTKIIVTHKSPDLDSCTAIWILKRFVFPKYDFKYHFVDVGERMKNPKNAIHVDTGSIDYDHHHTDEMISSASLVYTRNNLQDDALSKMIEFVVRIDHGKIKPEEFHFMHIVSALIGLRESDSEITIKATLTLLDGVYNIIKSELEALNDFKKGIIFASPIGKGIGFATGNPTLRRLAYQRGFDIYVFKDNKSGYAGYKVDGYSKIDFSKLYDYLKDKEPNADWFLHSSHQLLLCGSSKAPLKKKTKYSLKQLIKIVEKHA
jgi:hypothetical protein